MKKRKMKIIILMLKYNEDNSIRSLDMEIEEENKK